LAASWFDGEGLRRSSAGDLGGSEALAHAHATSRSALGQPASQRHGAGKAGVPVVIHYSPQ